MAAYRADIEVAVKGAQQLRRLKEEISATAKLADGLNNYLKNFGGGGSVVRSIRDINQVLSEAGRAFDKVALGTEEATIAATKYVTATNALNGALKERSELLAKIDRQQRASALAGIGVGMPSRQLLLPAAAPGSPAMSGGARRRVTGPVERLGGARSADEAAAALRLAQNLKQVVRPLSQVEALYAGIAGEASKLSSIKALPSTEMLNASARGLQRIELAEDRINRERQESVERLQQIDRLEASRERRAAKLEARARYLGDKQGASVFDMYDRPIGPLPAPRAAAQAAPGFGGGSLSNIALGAGFPLLFGGGPGAVIGGGLGGAFGGLAAQIGLSALGQQFDKLVGSAAKLGQALDPLTADLDAVTNAAGLAGTEAGRLIKELEESGDKTGALAEAANQLAFVVGTDGVIALKDFGDQTQELTNEFSILLSQISAGLAGLLRGPVAALLGAVEATTALNIAKTSDDPVLQGLQKQLQSSGPIFNIGGVAVGDAEKRLEIESKIVDRVRELRLQRQKEIASAGVVQESTTAQLNLANAELNLARAGTDLTKDSVYELSKKVIEARSYVGLQGIEFDANQKIAGQNAADVVLLKEKTALAELDRRRQEAFERKAKSQGSGRSGQRAFAASQGRTAAIRANSEALFKAAVLQDQIASAERIGANQQALSLARLRDQVKLTGEYEAKIAKVADTKNKAEEIAALRQERNVKLVALQFKYENESSQLELQRKAAGYEITSQLQQETYLLEAKLSGKEKEAALELEIARQVLAANDPARSQEIADAVRRKAALQEQIELTQELKAVYADITMTIKQGVTDAIVGAIKGTQTLAEAALNLLNNLAQKVLEIGLNFALFGVASGTGVGGGLFGGLFKAEGGSVMGGSPYIVGERGPELFVPGRSGTIVPNNKLGGGGSTNVVVNVDATGSKVEGDNGQAKQLGTAISTAVRQELIKQQRPGGLLA